MRITEILTEAPANLNKLHSPAEYKKALQGFYKLSFDEAIAKQELDKYSNTVDAINKSGGTVYRAVWAESANTVNLSSPGLHWTVFPETAEEFINLEHGVAAYSDFKLTNKTEPSAFLIAAQVGPQSITNRKVDISYFPEEAEVNLVAPNAAKLKVIKKLNINW